MCEAFCRGGVSKCVKVLTLGDAVLPGRYDREILDLKSRNWTLDVLS